MARVIRIATCDDHPIFRDGLRRLLDLEPDLEVVCEANDGADVPALVQAHRPDVLLLDLNMPGTPGIETLRMVHANGSRVHVILLVATIREDEVVTALRLGARGVVLKESATQVLMRAIRAVVAGEYWVKREIVGPLIVASSLEGARADAISANRFGLTPRELEIARLVAAGCMNREIAERCGISTDTVKHHLSSVFDKTGVSNRLELALFAVHHQLAPTP